MRQCTRARDGAAAGARPRGGEVARGTVARIVNGRTFVLGDGLEVCLAAIEVPAVPLPQDAGGSPGGRVQGKLIGDGFARVSDRVGRGSAGELLGRERTARKARLGLWADPYYDVLSVETPVDVPALRGRFALVEGKVSSLRESGAMNFGQRRSQLRSRNETSAHSRRQVSI